MTNKQPVKYPSPKDLEYILSDSVKKTVLTAFLRKRGIFYFNTTQAELAHQLAFILWDAEALEEFRAMAYRASNKKILSGFTLTSANSFELNQIYDTVREKGVLITSGYKLNVISKIIRGNETSYEGTLSYTKKSAGRIAFIRTEERDASFTMKRVNEKEWQVEVDGGKSNDGKAVLNMLENIVKDYDISMKTMRIDSLTKGQTIIFFDKLAKHGISGEWEIEDVGRIYIKKDAGTKEENDDSDDTTEDTTEVTGEDLSGISNAILEGQNLREHEFVRKAEAAGYAFTSMTYLFSNKKTGAKIRLRAEFKGSPKIFEVALEDYELPTTNEDNGFRSDLDNLEDKENMRIRSEFWNNAQSIYYSALRE